MFVFLLLFLDYGIKQNILKITQFKEQIEVSFYLQLSLFWIQVFIFMCGLAGGLMMMRLVKAVQRLDVGVKKERKQWRVHYFMLRVNLFVHFCII